MARGHGGQPLCREAAARSRSSSSCIPFNTIHGGSGGFQPRDCCTTGGANQLMKPATQRRVPWVDVPETRRAIMRANKSKDTKPELVVRCLLHAMGYRFRLHRRDLAGNPDIVMPGRRKAFFVHGCFWHGHEGCRRASMPATRQEYWLPKIERNRVRDRRAVARLRREGWSIAVVWECATARPDTLRVRLHRFLEGPHSRPLKASALSTA